MAGPELEENNKREAQQLFVVRVSTFSSLKIK
jgi:hypothetical protein